MLCYNISLQPSLDAVEPEIVQVTFVPFVKALCFCQIKKQSQYEELKNTQKTSGE